MPQHVESNQQYGGWHYEVSSPLKSHSLTSAHTWYMVPLGIKQLQLLHLQLKFMDLSKYQQFLWIFSSILKFWSHLKCSHFDMQTLWQTFVDYECKEDLESI